MQFRLTIPALLAAVFLGSMASATPIACPDVSGSAPAHNQIQTLSVALHESPC